ncbi:hypothetical protein HMPREF1250_2202 [Megasphaera vaginalis (ex Srinivasan et al. 2021)]|uniref:Uncharacterized protein n=1 Tax=Megasphaera vaginalis (ex Srinivasan et al. 2021) TaxID=1111454 RepID=U7UR69_9FIRM|nr:hypothetical protein HMPREF1250_2202 [Megasphaera vaginalis (ex Srinivasan et al. 2021)]
MSGTYTAYNKNINGVSSIIVLEKKNNDNLYECSGFYVDENNRKYKKSSTHWVSKFNPDIKQMVADPNNNPLNHRPLFFNEDLSSVGFDKMHTSTFKKVSKSEAQKYDKFVEE